ncbi:Maintenance of telomere capping protein 6 [Aspergillus hancockii]|nr:Maintenance of telomere capping protein 6 [Aspergillus hancockii]
MSLNFNPDQSSLINTKWETVFLSERDVAGQIPINYVTGSGVSVTSACFGNNIFETQSAEKCLSNLLSVGYRRFIVDLYWSVDARTWIFCPVAIPKNVPTVTVSATPSATPATTSAAQGTSTVISNSSGSLVYELGPYLCSNDLSLSGLIDIFQGYYKDTTSQLNVYIRYITFNLHVAASAASPFQPASKVSGDELPSYSERVDVMMDDSLFHYIYTPTQLAKERSNLNESWYVVDDGYKPITEYFITHELSDGTQSTPDGWPGLKYVQLAKERRLLLEYGSIDPQLEDYNLTAGTNEVVFPPGYLTSTIPAPSDDKGGLDYACLYDADAYQVSQVNSSWALSNGLTVPQGVNETSTLLNLSDKVLNITACGLSPILNSTLFNKTADNAAMLYKNISLSSTWAWADGEPRGSDVSEDIDTPQHNRCAVMDISLGGHWRVANCTEVRHAACRVGNLPYTWTISDNAYSYSNAYSEACPKNTTMGVPRTSLENTYLYRYLLAEPNNIMDPASPDLAKREIWLDFNSRDIASCWVTGGPEASCPYASDPKQLQKRTVLVAAIAGIVICIITALTLFVKCNANRRNSRRGKRVIQGWEYEGVPS